MNGASMMSVAVNFMIRDRNLSKNQRLESATASRHECR